MTINSNVWSTMWMNLPAKLMSNVLCWQIKPMLVRTDLPQMVDFGNEPLSQLAKVLGGGAKQGCEGICKKFRFKPELEPLEPGLWGSRFGFANPPDWTLKSRFRLSQKVPEPELDWTVASLFLWSKLLHFTSEPLIPHMCLPSPSPLVYQCPLFQHDGCCPLWSLRIYLG